MQQWDQSSDGITPGCVEAQVEELKQRIKAVADRISGISVRL
jgi:hypothetical protein